jgi:hypothetical protein
LTRERPNQIIRGRQKEAIGIREHGTSARKPEQSERHATPTTHAGAADVLLNLQRQAGNGAVAALLSQAPARQVHRQPQAPPEIPRPTAEQALGATWHNVVGGISALSGHLITAQGIQVAQFVLDNTSSFLAKHGRTIT